MHDSGLKSMELLASVCSLSIVLYTPFWFYYDGYNMVQGDVFASMQGGGTVRRAFALLPR